jgi:ATP-binding protein involved in chromosome partitioning
LNINKEEIVQRLKNVKYPGYSRDVVSFGIIKDVNIEGNKLIIKLWFSTESEEKRAKIIEAIKEAIGDLQFESVDFEIMESKVGSKSQQGEIPREEIPGVKYIIAVASGKGGVGKSTIAVNLAYALANLDYKVGILDADVYGPSIPTMLGVSAQPESEENKILPIEKYNMRIMSIGFFLSSQDDALIWRGPMVMRAVEQLLFDVKWGELDFLVVDLPPGTGDAQLTLAQRVPLSGVVVVTTPQDVALIDARKAVNMFRRVGVPILGIVENMSYFVCPHCGAKTDIFAHGGGKITSLSMRVPFLGEIPIIPSLRELSDEGTPYAASKNEKNQDNLFEDIAKKIAAVFIKK